MVVYDRRYISERFLLWKIPLHSTDHGHLLTRDRDGESKDIIQRAKGKAIFPVENWEDLVIPNI